MEAIRMHLHLLINFEYEETITTIDKKIIHCKNYVSQ